MSNVTAIEKREQVGLKAVEDFRFSEEQNKIILDSYLNGASPAEARVLLELARIRQLNPILGEIHFVKRWKRDDEQNRAVEVWSAQVGIDGFRTIAERTGLYDGQDEAEYEYDKEGRLVLCRVRVYRRGIDRPFVGVARYSEYVQRKKDNTPTKMWNEKPYIMLSKCAEALAMRKAFPRDAGGLYIPEEIQRDEDQESIMDAVNASKAPPLPTSAAKPQIQASNQIEGEVVKTTKKAKGNLKIQEEETPEPVVAKQSATPTEITEAEKVSILISEATCRGDLSRLASKINGEGISKEEKAKLIEQFKVRSAEVK